MAGLEEFDELIRKASPGRPDPLSRFNALTEPKPQVAEGHLPTTLGEELYEPVRLLRQASTEHFDDLKADFKHHWRKDSLLGGAWQALKTAGDAAMYVMSPAQAVIEAAAEPFETLTGWKGLAHKVGEVGSVASTFYLDPLMAVGPITGLNKVARAVGEGKIGQGVKEALSPTFLPTKVDRWVTDPETGAQIPLRAMPEVKQPGLIGSTARYLQGKPTYNPNPGLGKVLRRDENQAEKASRLMIAQMTAQELENDRARAALEPFQKLVGGMDHDQRMEFNYGMDGDPAAAPMPTGMQPFVQTLRKYLDESEARLVSIDALQNYSRSHWPRIFKDPRAVEGDVDAFQAAQAQTRPRRSLRPGRGIAGLLPRVRPTMRESIEAGRELVTDNPIELAMLRLQGSNGFYWGTQMGRELKRQPYLRFLNWSDRHLAPSLGLEALDDRFMEAWLPPAEASHHFEAQAIHREVFDADMRERLHDVARFMGLTPEHTLVEDDPLLKAYHDAGKSVAGYANRAGKLVSRFGSADDIMMHEIGHQMEFKYGLIKLMQQDPKAWGELERLGLARDNRPPQVLRTQDPDRYDYLIDPDERIANLFNAYWRAPELLKKVAPTAAQRLDAWLALPRNRGLKGVVDNVKPGVRHGGDERVQKFEEDFYKFFPGQRFLGQWYAPPEVARVFNNYVSEGFGEGWSQGGTAGDVIQGFRKMSNALTQLQLGLSAFHLGMISIDTVATGLSRLPDVLKHGEFGETAKIVGSAAAGPFGALYSGVTTSARGKKLKAFLEDPTRPATLEMRAIAQAFTVSGGRVGLPTMFRSSEMGGFLRAFQGGYLSSSIRETLDSVKNPNPVVRAVIKGAKMGARLAETTNEAIMSRFVPNVKLGVFHDMMGDWLKSNPAAGREELMAGAQKVWDSIDNRMGEMVYDNLFWSRTQKDLAFIAVRAVGWNLGTIRELGGGLTDAVKSANRVLTASGPAEITARTQYSVALPVAAAINGAMLTYMFTGKGPQQMLDYFYPRNGRMTPDGVPERLSIPSYVKDVVMYNYDPLGTLQNKLNPIFEIIAELARNKDYYGGGIVSPLRPTPDAIQYSEYLARQLIPFGIKGLLRQIGEGADVFPTIMSEFGFVPAPTSITNPKKAEGWERSQDVKAFRAWMREKARGYWTH
jgi:hypothetical protein